MDQQSLAGTGSFQSMATQILGTVAQNIGGVVFDGRHRGRVLEEDHPCPHRYIKLLVGINGNRIGPLDAGQQMTVTVGKKRRTTPCSINMEMTAELCGKISHGLQRIHITGFGGPADADQGKRQDILVLQPAALLTQRLEVNPVVFPGFYLDQLITTDAKQICGLAQRVVAAL